MSPGRWERIKELFEAAAALSPAEQAPFLRQACEGDADLLLEVEKLVKQHNRLGTFLNEPLFGSLSSHAFPNQRGEILGNFRIIKVLGSGGMGRVYEASETIRNRHVALKVLNANFSLYRDDISRFEREAWIGGHLNHPNLVKAYGQGEISGLHYISMELMEGPSLATDILVTKAEWDQAPAESNIRAQRVHKMIALFADIADALHYVHENGIIHRDIKPPNLLLTDRGSKMLLSDFGLARDEAMSQLTRQGDFLGTIRYMSPEQILKTKNKLDRRTDIWSLGVSLYEAVTLTLPYSADTEQGYLSQLGLNDPVPARDRHHAIPRDLETVLMHCLEREPAARYQTAADLRDDLRRLASGEPILARRPNPLARFNRLAKRNRKPLAVAAITAGLLLLLLFAAYFITAPTREPAQLLVQPFCTFPGGEYEPKFSPDEKHVAFVWNRENEQTFNIYVQNLDRSGLRRITTDEANEGSPAWSPDGASLAFIHNSPVAPNSGVFIKPLSGGTARKVTSLVPEEHHFQRRLDWSPDGRYLALADSSGPGKPLAIFLVSPADGHRWQITTPVPGTQGDTAPAFSPDGQTLTFLRFVGSNIDDLYAVPVSGGSPRRITTGDSFISDYAWLPNGRELAVNTKQYGPMDLWIVPATGGNFRRINGPVSGAYFIAVSPRKQYLAFSAWSADTNIWRVEPVPGRPSRPRLNQLIASTLDDRSAQFSPDASRIVFRSNQSGNDELWIADASGTNPSQLTSFQGPLTGSPRWSKDGASIAFDSLPTGRANIYVVSSRGGSYRRITTGPGDNVVPSWSADGKFIYFASNRLGDWQVWKVPMQGESPSHPAVQITRHGGFSAMESLDSQWLFYAKGREVPGIWKIPVGGGEETLVTARLQTGFWGYWTVGPSAIYYICCNAKDHCAIESYSLSSRQASVIAELPKEPPFSDSGLGLSPDAKSFLIPQVDHSQSNIMLGTNFK